MACITTTTPFYACRYTVFWSCLCFLLCGTTESLHSLYELCPYTTFCQGGPLISDHGFAETGKMPCCLPCSCHDECDRIGNCCPDKEPARQPSQTTRQLSQRYPCRQLNTYHNNYLNLVSGTNAQLMFRIIDSCPDEFILANESDSRCYGDATIDDLYLVTDVKSNITYVNERCARCNGVTDIVKWDLNIELSEILNYQFSSFADRDLAILNNSYRFYAIPPSLEVGLLSVCSRHVVDYCNQTSHMTYIDPIVQNNCRKGKELPMLQEFPIKTFANPYCVMCNFQFSSEPPAECDAIHFGIDIARSIVYPLSAVLLSNGPLSYEMEDSVVSSRCEIQQVFDPVSKSCINLQCPPTTYPEHGQCKKVFDELYGVSVDLHFVISEEEMSEVSLRQKSDQLFEFILKTFKNNKLNCDICSVSMHENGTAVFITLLTKPFCDHLVLLNFIGLQRRKGHFNFNAQYGLRFELTSDVSTHPHFFYIHHRKHICKSRITFNRHTIHCPSIALDLPSIERYGYDTNKEWLFSVIKSSEMLENGRLLICLDDYNDINRYLSNSMDTQSSCKKCMYMIIFGLLFWKVV